MRRSPGDAVAWIGFVGIVFGLASAGVGPRAAAQSVEFGASPGRATYRPPAQWNNGPFYTVNHWNPWAPRPAHDTGLVYSMPNQFPYATAPRGLYSAYETTRGATYPYAEGFSPYSGYAEWFRRTYGYTPTEQDLARATRGFFRSSPVAPSPRYLAPQVAQAYYRPTQQLVTARQSTVARNTAAATARPLVVQPEQTVPRGSAPGTAVYRYGR